MSDKAAADANKAGAGAEVSLASPVRWGLLPDPGPDGKHHLAFLLRYWFVQFNPLYFVSAFWVLCGVFLVARHIDSVEGLSPERAQLLLFIVIQAYELLLVGGAAFLVHRAGAIRPAVLLLLLEALFMFDCTFRLEGLALSGPLAAPLAFAVWITLTMLKVRAAASAMRASLTRAHYAAIAVTAAGIVSVIAALSRPDSNKVVVLQLAGWFGTAVILLMETHRPALTTLLAHTREDGLLTERCVRGMFRLLTGIYFYHVWSYILLAADVEIRAVAILPQAGALLLLMTITRRKETDIWRFGAFTVAATLPTPVTLPYALFLIAAVFGLRVLQGARRGIAAGAAFAAYAGCWLLPWRGWDFHLPPLPGLWSWQTVTLGIALGLIGWFLRDRLVWAMVGAGLAYGIYLAFEPLVPKSELGLGMLMLGAGFITLALGIAVNWRFRAGAASPQSGAAANAAAAPDAAGIP